MIMVRVMVNAVMVAIFEFVVGFAKF